jgi:hypothetical protein
MPGAAHAVVAPKPPAKAQTASKKDQSSPGDWDDIRRDSSPACKICFERPIPRHILLPDKGDANDKIAIMVERG